MLRHYVQTLGASKIGRRFLATTFWSIVGEVSKGLMLLSMVLVARLLGTQDYGGFGIIRTTTITFATVGGMGLGLTANRFVAKFRDENKQYSGQIIGSTYALAGAVGMLIAVAVFIGAAPLAGDFLGQPKLAPGFRIASALLLLNAINGAQIGILQGLEAYRRLALAGFLQGALAMVCLLAGAYFFGLNGALAGFLTYTTISVLTFHVLIEREAAKQQIRIHWGAFRSILPIFWGFSTPVALMVIAVAPSKWLSETLLAKRVGFEELGLFHASMTIASMFIAAASTLNAPLISLMSNLEHSGPGPKRQYLNLYGSWYVYLILAIPYALFPRVSVLLFGDSFDRPQFLAAALILVLYGGLLIYHQGIWRLIALEGSMWFSFWTNVAEGLVLILAFYLLMGHGAVGLSAAYVFSYLVRIAISVPFLRKRDIVPLSMIRDKYFVLTLAALVGLVGVQIYGVL